MTPLALTNQAIMAGIQDVLTYNKKNFDTALGPLKSYVTRFWEKIGRIK